MREKGIDISRNRTESVFDFFSEGRIYNFVVTVCDESSREKCPIFPRRVQRLHWSFPDPGAIQGSEKEILEGIRIIRDKIENTVKDFISQIITEFKR